MKQHTYIYIHTYTKTTHISLILLLGTDLWNNYIVGCLHDNLLCHTLSHVGLPLGSQLQAGGPCEPPLPTPSPHCIVCFQLVFFFWLNSHEHKLSISSNSWSSAWPRKITLVEKLFPSPPALLTTPRGRRKPKWKAKSALGPGTPIGCRKQTFPSSSTFSQEK